MGNHTSDAGQAGSKDVGGRCVHHGIRCADARVDNHLRGHEFVTKIGKQTNLLKELQHVKAVNAIDTHFDYHFNAFLCKTLKESQEQLASKCGSSRTIPTPKLLDLRHLRRGKERHGVAAAKRSLQERMDTKLSGLQMQRTGFTLANWEPKDVDEAVTVFLRGVMRTMFALFDMDRQTFMHGDIRPDNITVRADGFWFINWEQAQRSIHLHDDDVEVTRASKTMDVYFQSMYVMIASLKDPSLMEATTRDKVIRLHDRTAYVLQVAAMFDPAEDACSFMIDRLLERTGLPDFSDDLDKIMDRQAGASRQRWQALGCFLPRLVLAVLNGEVFDVMSVQQAAAILKRRGMRSIDSFGLAFSLIATMRRIQREFELDDATSSMFEQLRLTVLHPMLDANLMDRLMPDEAFGRVHECFRRFPAVCKAPCAHLPRRFFQRVEQPVPTMEEHVLAALATTTMLNLQKEVYQVTGLPIPPVSTHEHEEKQLDDEDEDDADADADERRRRVALSTRKEEEEEEEAKAPPPLSEEEEEEEEARAQMQRRFEVYKAERLREIATQRERAARRHYAHHRRR